MNKFENLNPVQEKPSEQLGLERVRSYLKSSYEKMQKRGVPIDSEGRIDPSRFDGCYSKAVLEADNKEVKRLQEVHEEGLSETEIQRRRSGNHGELELLAAAVFSEFMGDRFDVVRSSLFDDFNNEVETILVDRETGNIVCAFDEVGELKGKKFEDKKNKVLGINKDQLGARLKYGIHLDSKTGAITPQCVEHIPIFYIALTSDLLGEGLKKFQVDPENNKKLFQYFLLSLGLQIKELDLKSLALSKEVNNKLDIFNQAIGKYFRISK